MSFFARWTWARLTGLTKSADVGNLLGLDHGGHAILSWTLSPPVVIEAFEPNTPLLEERLLAMEACVEAGYPVRAVVMPILPLPEGKTIYGEFLVGLLRRVRLSRLTLGSICSYPQALRLSKQKLGDDNLISTQLDRRRHGATDGRLTGDCASLAMHAGASTTICSVPFAASTPNWRWRCASKSRKCWSGLA